MIYGIDAVHGHGNVYGATVFPHNIGLGATRDPALVRKVGEATAEEVRATGIPWNFAPCICVARDERRSRTYESFSEDPALVSRWRRPSTGCRVWAGADHSDRVLATAKHYAGDGNTKYDQRPPPPTWACPGTSSGTRSIRASPSPAALISPGSTSRPTHRPSAARRGQRHAVLLQCGLDEDGVGDPMKMYAHEELFTGVLKGR